MYTNIQTQPYDRRTWERPRTTHRYFHPPKSERMFTLWAEGKIIIGENDDGSDVADKRNGHEYHSDLESGGIWMLYGADRKAFLRRKRTLFLPMESQWQRYGPRDPNAFRNRMIGKH